MSKLMSLIQISENLFLFFHKLYETLYNVASGYKRKKEGQTNGFLCAPKFFVEVVTLCSFHYTVVKRLFIYLFLHLLFANNRMLAPKFKCRKICKQFHKKSRKFSKNKRIDT